MDYLNLVMGFVVGFLVAWFVVRYATRYFYNQYTKDKPEVRHCQELQEYLINLMTQNGFELASRKEYLHFDYKK